MRTRDKNGRFKRINEPFSLKNFNDGYIDNRGRFRVYCPNHARAYRDGYILRAIIAYELYHNVTVPSNMDIHHKDGDRLNDSKENLEMMSHGKHTRLHSLNSDAWITKICIHCGKKFKISRWRLRQKEKRGKFCSQKCYHAHNRSPEHKQHISNGLKRAYKEGRRGS